MVEVREPRSNPFDLLDDRVQTLGRSVRCTRCMPSKYRFTPLLECPREPTNLFHVRTTTVFDDRIDPQRSQVRFTPQRVQVTGVLFRFPRLEHSTMRVTERKEHIESFPGGRIKFLRREHQQFACPVQRLRTLV